MVVQCDGKANISHGYRGPNAAEDLLRRLQEEGKKIKENLACLRPMIFAGNAAISYNNAINCHVFGGPLTADSVSDHCHITGEYRGAAHHTCNLK